MNASEESLCEVGRWLQSINYEFTTVTPATHRRVNARPIAKRARHVRDVFGWSQPFEPTLLPHWIVQALSSAEVLDHHDGLMQSRVRFSTLAGDLYVHSAFPTNDESSVFFGPDTYRFCALLANQVKVARRVVDVCCGSGAGGLSLARVVKRIVLADINDKALSFARVNTELAGLRDRVEIVAGDLLAEVSGPFDLVVANPPYLVDAAHRTYRDGGGDDGTALGLRIVQEALSRLHRPGHLVLYTGAPIVDGEDRFRAAAAKLLDPASVSSRYYEIDPDVFGEELQAPAYAAVERIAAVGLSVDCH